MKICSIAMVTFGLFLSHAPLALAGDSVMFTGFSASRTDTEAVLEVLERDLGPNDYLGVGIGSLNPKLESIIGGKNHTFTIPASVDGVVQSANKHAAGMVMYDIEHWNATPPDERGDPVGAIQKAQRAAEGTGVLFEVAPDGRFIGIEHCTGSWEAGILPKIHYRGIAMVNLQAQALLSQECISRMGKDAAIAQYIDFVKTVAANLRVHNGNIKVFTQLSFRHSPPPIMLSIARALKDTVEGFYLAYPRENCLYCTASNLDAVLKGIKRDAE